LEKSDVRFEVMSPGPAPLVIFLGGAGVRMHERPPPRHLAPFISHIWHLTADRETTLRVIPDGCTDIIEGDVVGSLTGGLIAHLRAGESTHGVRFRPGGFTALYGVPAGELVDLRLPLADVIRRPMSLDEASRDADHPDPLAAVALHVGDVRALAREYGYSERHFHRRVLAATGHGPKRLSRIGRMQALLAAGRGESWAATAAAFGFHDEAHMINDVRRLADASPHELLSKAG
jgi:AraC-like DNA-binding protein